MESNLFIYDEILELENFAIKKYKDSIYKGMISKDRKREGFGVIVYKNNRVFEG